MLTYNKIGNPLINRNHLRLYHLQPSCDVTALTYYQLNQPKKETLCVTFLNASNSFQNNYSLLQNISSLYSNIPFYLNLRVMRTFCDWVLIFYDGTIDEVENTCKQANQYLHKYIDKTYQNSSKIIHCKRSIESMKVNTYYDKSKMKNITLSIHKILMYENIIPYIDNYKQLFFIDNMI